MSFTTFDWSCVLWVTDTCTQNAKTLTVCAFTRNPSCAKRAHIAILLKWSLKLVMPENVKLVISKNVKLVIPKKM